MPRGQRPRDSLRGEDNAGGIRSPHLPAMERFPWPVPGGGRCANERMDVEGGAGESGGLFLAPPPLPHPPGGRAAAIWRRKRMAKRILTPRHCVVPCRSQAPLGNASCEALLRLSDSPPDSEFIPPIWIRQADLGNDKGELNQRSRCDSSRLCYNPPERNEQ